MESLNGVERSLLERNPADFAENIGLYIGKSEAMSNVIEQAVRWAKTDYHLLIEGETGTGKELMARLVHEISCRAGGRFVGINCGALSETLLESELFGHEKGAFTGAQRDRKGVFEQASGGTLFLDEIGEASWSNQVKLLRVLETKEFYRIGSEISTIMNARMVTATHQSLRKKVAQGGFREDLMYRLDVGRLTMPPLRDRKEDIPGLIQWLFQKEGFPVRTLTDEALKKLYDHSWPGNIRELNHVMIKTAILLSEEVKTIHADDLQFDESVVVKPNDVLQEKLRYIETLPEALEEIRLFERKMIREKIQRTLEETFGNRREAARRLQVTERKLRYWLNEK